MILPVILMLQSALPAEPLPDSALRHVPTCDPAAQDQADIVVCARPDQEEFRLRHLPPRYVKQQKGPWTEVDLGNGARANAYAAQQKSPDGKADKRILVTLTLPF